MDSQTDIQEKIRAQLVRLASERSPASSFCPSEAARAVSQNWRPLMPAVRQQAAEIGLIATQQGQVVDPLCARGPIRLQRDPS